MVKKKNEGTKSFLFRRPREGEPRGLRGGMSSSTAGHCACGALIDTDDNFCRKCGCIRQPSRTMCNPQRSRGLPCSHALAVVMGTHDRLGACSAVHRLGLEDGLLRMIVDLVAPLMEPAAVVLMSSSVSNELDKVCQRNMLAALAAKKVRFYEVDGADPVQKELRGRLFDLSGLRGKYPQVFVQDVDARYEFVGDWADLQALLDSDGLPVEVLHANPGIRTFTSVFGACFLGAGTAGDPASQNDAPQSNCAAL